MGRHVPPPTTTKQNGMVAQSSGGGAGLNPGQLGGVRAGGRREGRRRMLLAVGWAAADYWRWWRLGGGLVGWAAVVDWRRGMMVDWVVQCSLNMRMGSRRWQSAALQRARRCAAPHRHCLAALALSRSCQSQCPVPIRCPSDQWPHHHAWPCSAQPCMASSSRRLQPADRPKLQALPKGVASKLSPYRLPGLHRRADAPATRSGTPISSTAAARSAAETTCTTRG